MLENNLKVLSLIFFILGSTFNIKAFFSIIGSVLTLVITVKAVNFVLPQMTTII